MLTLDLKVKSEDMLFFAEEKNCFMKCLTCINISYFVYSHKLKIRNLNNLLENLRYICVNTQDVCKNCKVCKILSADKNRRSITCFAGFRKRNKTMLGFIIS